MITLPLHFKFRFDQEEITHKVTSAFNKHEEVGLDAPTDWGKTITLCIAALSQPLPVTYVTSTYASCQEIIDTLEMLGKKHELSIAVPKGRSLIRRTYCKMRTCSECEKRKIAIPHLNKKDFIGKAVDVKWVQKNAEECCPYRYLHELSKIADWVVTHYANLPNPIGRGGRLERTGFLVADEVDKALQPTDMLVVAYRISERGWHLETSKEELPIKKAVDILKLLKKEYNPYEKGHPDHEYEILDEWCTYFVKQLDWLMHLVFRNPASLEKEQISTAKEDGVITEDSVTYGLMTSSQRLKSYTKLFNALLKHKHIEEVFKYTIENFDKNSLRKLKPEDRGLIEDLIYVLKLNKQFYFKKVRYSPRLKEGYVEIWMVTGRSNFQQRVEYFDKKLYASATFPSNITGEIAIVKTIADENAHKKHVVLVPTSNIMTRVLKELLQKYNILGITTSTRRAEQAVKKYGGQIIQKNTFIKAIVREARCKKGLLYWLYYGSKHGRAINQLACFDGVMFQDFLDLSDPLSLGDEQQYEDNCIRTLYQMASRVFRTVDGKHRARFLLTCNEKAFELLMKIVPNWQFHEAATSKGAVEFVQESAELLPLIPSLKPITIKLPKSYIQKYDRTTITLTDEDVWKKLFL